MTSPAVRARDTPDRTVPQQIDGLLIVDTDKVRARYECYRPDCPQRREGPAFGPDAVLEFVRAIKTEHLARHHYGEKP
ncbi:hypothetical protein QFZ75_003651 [Streptomyces sp. V3I8]|uniref:hypothetical protein n=1 Tax=Streptomyces sp. V3I8 TaxID=3042279 RepID=UPI002788DDBE|nr:hypothetical protein [Streptomyces sp. V3I8]MDQ1037235.1 hypothetical protein [Streptomyces sp. V3I8]